MSTLSIRTRRWTRKEYDRLVELGFMRGQISRTTDRQPGGSCPRGLSPAGPRGVSALRLEVPPRTGAEARGERLAARRPDRTDRRRRSAAVGRASPQAPLNPRAAARRPNETMMRVAELWRYPVKSLAGERLERAELTVGGITGDRVVHVRDARGRVITARTHPKLLGLRTTLGPDGEPRIGGRPWASEESAEAVREAAGPDARLARYDGRERFDVLPLLVATDGAIAALGVDRRRLRPNILVEGVEGLAERAWPGRRLRIGDALIAVEKLRGRCVMTTFDPDTQAQDLSVLTRIVAEFGGRMGLDCDVLERGVLRVGDSVELV